MPIDSLKPRRRATADSLVSLAASVTRLKPQFYRRLAELSPRVYGLVTRLSHWRREHLRSKVTKIIVVVLIAATTFSVVTRGHDKASALTQGDAIVTYGVAANTTPQVRTYGSAANTFGAAGNTVAGAVAANMVTRTSPTKQEATVGYVDNATNTLRVMCYNGTTWTNEWNVAVGGNTTSQRRFDIAYETNSGDAMVLYSTNVGTTNELAYRTKPGSTGCGTANWAAATNLDPIRTTGTVQWVKMAWDRRGTSNLITAIWGDSTFSLSTMIWSGTAWGNEPSAVLTSGGLEVTGTGTLDVDTFDVEYESVSGDVMVVWSLGTANSTNQLKYTTCPGGTSSCTWSATANIPTVATLGTNLDISANPYTNEIVMAAIQDTATTTLAAAYWSGSAWTGAAGVDTSAVAPTAGRKIVTTGWLSSGGVTRSIIVYADATATTTSISYYTGINGNFTAGTDFAGAPVPGAFRWMDIQMDPYNHDRLMLTYADANNDLFAKRLVMTSTPAFTWTNADGGSAALEASLAQATVASFSFAYWRQPAVYEQKQYHWYDNADSVQPTGSGLGGAAENAGATITSRATIARLRANLTNSGSDLPANFQDFKLQYATSTSGPWTDVSSPWCNTASPVACNTNWIYRKKITFNNATSSSTLTNFPVLVNLTTNNFDFTKARADGFDIVFIGSNGAALNFQREKYDGSTTGIFWVNVPSIPNNNSSSMYMYYGNSAASSDPITGTVSDNTWESNFKGVWHLKENPASSSNCAGGAGTKEVCDSTSLSNDGDTAGVWDSSDQMAGQIDGSLQFDRSIQNEYLDISTAANDFNPTTGTMSFWAFRPFADTSANYYTAFSFGVNTSNNVELYWDGPSKTFHATYLAGGTTKFTTIPAASIPPNTWASVTVTWDKTNDQLKAYVNGVQVGATVTGLTTWAGSSTIAYLGYTIFTGSDYWQGQEDEARLSAVVRSDDWIKASYLSDTDSFNTFSLEETQGGGVWKYYNNSTPADASTITTNLLTGSTSTVKESYTESNPTGTNPTAINGGQTGEWDFALDPAIICNGIYYFRIVESDGTPMTTYTTYPQLTVNAAAPLIQVAPLNQVMHHGGYFRGETKQPYSCDWVAG